MIDRGVCSCWVGGVSCCRRCCCGEEEEDKGSAVADGDGMRLNCSARSRMESMACS